MCINLFTAEYLGRDQVLIIPNDENIQKRKKNLTHRKRNPQLHVSINLFHNNLP